MRHGKLAILGCGGFVGSHLIDRILAVTDYRIEGWDIAFDKIAHHLGHARVEVHQHYLDAETTLSELAPVIGEVDAVISLAAVCTPASYVASPLRTIRANFIDAYRLVDLCAEHGTWLIHASTSEVYGRTLSSYLPGDGYADPDLFEQREDETPLVLGPTINHRWSYATAKQLLERYILAHHRENGLPFTIFRPYNWFGPRMDFLPGRDGEGVPRVLACFVSALLDGQPMRLVDGGGARRTITYIDDAVDALMSILEKPEQSRDQIFNVGNGDGEITIRVLAHTMRELAAEISGLGDYLDHPIEDVTSLEVYGAGYEDCDRRVPDLTKAQTRLGWRAKTGLRETLRITMQHYFDAYGRSAELPTARAAEPTTRPAVLSGAVAAHSVA